jgi:hypothetical protein
MHHDPADALQLLYGMFPNLKHGDAQIASKVDAAQNCLGFVIGDKKRPWWPWSWSPAGYGAPGGLVPPNYWPDDLPSDETVPTIRMALERFGCKVCDSVGDPNRNEIERAVIYASAAGTAAHVAKELPNGRWASKLGDFHDIHHRTTANLEGNVYGHVVLTLCRPREGAVIPT